MKANICLASILSLFMSSVAFGDDMDGQPEVAPIAGELIGTDPIQQVECKELKESWKNKYREIRLLEKKSAYVSDEKQISLDETKNDLVGGGCILNTDKLEDEVEEEMK